MNAEEAPLAGLFLRLVRSGVPLSARDYRDALEAMRVGYGLNRREELLWLCQALWTRNEREAVALERLFREFPAPTVDDVRRIAGRDSRDAAAGGRAAERGADRAAQDRANEAPEPVPEVEFAAAAAAGLALPSARIPFDAAERFVFAPRPTINQRALTVVWRRFRLARRSGARTEVDLDATVVEKSRRGLVDAPVLRPARTNQARIVVLVDASASMAPWRHMDSILRESLGQGRFARSDLYYFDNAPSSPLFEDVEMKRATDVREAMRRSGSSVLLVVSDAGSARRRTNVERVAATRAFIAEARAAWAPVAWLNPLPRFRWRRTSADRIARIPGVAMFELNEDDLVRAVDHLRGTRPIAAR